MFSAIRKRVTPATVIATLALAFAMTGGAYAASRYVITSTKQIKPSVLKSLQGKTGASGAAGAPGPQGAAGAAGPAGAAGAKGETGAKGEAGAKGETGAKGEIGAKGAPGSPWSVGGVLPSEETETGTYVISSANGAAIFAGEYLLAEISFPIPLSASLTPSHTIFVPAPQEGSTTPAECENAEHPGAASAANPEAAPGYLCVFEGQSNGLKTSEVVLENPGAAQEGASTSGAVLFQIPTHVEETYGYGTWAVTAP